MLSRPCSVLLMLSIAGCAASTESAPDDSTEVTAPAEPLEPGPPYGADDGYRDPCLYGEVVIVQGHAVQVPIPCAADELDKGDPPPLELDADGVDRGDADPLRAAPALRAAEQVSIVQTR